LALPIFDEICAGWNNGNNNTGGDIGGGQIGYNFQVTPTFVVGAEADFQGTSLGARSKSWRREDIALTGPPGFPSARSMRNHMWQPTGSARCSTANLYRGGKRQCGSYIRRAWFFPLE
jgi:opacity protein-like surface antigen